MAGAFLIFLAAATSPSPTIHQEVWGLCLQRKVLLYGLDAGDGEETLTVAQAMLDCQTEEAKAREEMVQAVADATGDDQYASSQGDTLILATKISVAEDLLSRARGAHEARGRSPR